MRLTLDVWMGIGEGREGSAGGRPSLRLTLEPEIEEGMTGRTFMTLMAHRHQAIGEKVFHGETGAFQPNVLVVLNDRVITAAQLCDAVLREGDTIAVFPLDAGG